MIGSISHGTLRTQDLLRACADTLETFGTPQIEPYHGSCLVSDAREWADRLDGEPTPQEQEQAESILCDISDRLNDLAPEGTYFGMHEGDGSDLGFWPILD